MIPLISSLLTSLSQNHTKPNTDQVEGDGEQQSEISSPENLSSVPPSSKPIDAMDTSSDSDNEVIFDSTNGERFQTIAMETSSSCDYDGPETNANTYNLLKDEGESLDSESFLQTPQSSKKAWKLSANTQPGGVDAVSLPFASTLIYPMSQYGGYVPPLPTCNEDVAIQELRQAIEEEHSGTTGSNAISEDEDFIEFVLTDFAIYLPQKSHHAFELRGLQGFASKVGHLSMLFDGILSAGQCRRYVQAVPFDLCSLGNYGTDNHTVGDSIWIQSTRNNNTDLYYRLKTPSVEYQRFHRDFLWLADLAKHFVDYCEACEQQKKLVSVHNFRKDFSDWVLNAHHGSAEFQKWYAKYKGNDFRQAVSANINFLFKESIGQPDGHRYRKHQIWNELLEIDFVSSQKVEQGETIVTPYVYECFGHLRFSQYLKPVSLVERANKQQLGQGNLLHLTVDGTTSHPVVEIPSTSRSHTLTNVPTPAECDMERRKKIKAIKVGDVLSVPTDKDGNWKDEGGRWKAPDDCWYLYVQAVYESRDAQRSFDGIWLSKPSDTSCAKMKYPYSNELFLSDNCTCGDTRYKENEVIDVVAVAWHGQPSTCKGLFVRQTVLENENFVTLKDAHKKCEHFKNDKDVAASETGHKYPIGQTVLVAQTKLIPPRRSSKHDLDPYEIVKYEISNLKHVSILRRLLRRNEIAGQSSCRPNELVYSDETFIAETKNIERTCLVRFYSEADVTNEAIPAPYSRNGTGNAFYITSKLARDGDSRKLVHIGTEVPPSLIQGFDPFHELSRKKLRGLDLYCGGGNFGRGLEEGHAVHHKWAVDMDKIAIHTYHANLQEPKNTDLYFGSVNDLLFQALQGNPKNSPLIPRSGKVDFISAGSPCQGFSRLNAVNRDKKKGLKNQSMVASVAAYVDFYRPKYGLLENVVAMGQKGEKRDDDVCSQLICTIVGMGYQLSTFYLDAWSFGSPQSRSRIFVAFAAPGYEPILHPELSHSHPLKIKKASIGELANEEPFGERRFVPTPFKFLAARQAVSDLPYLGDGATQACIPYPDHVLNNGVSEIARLRLAAIPKFPYGMNFARAWDEGKGTMTKEERALFPDPINSVGRRSDCVAKNSKAWGRVHPNRLFSTMVASSSVRDSRMGTIVHWDQNRSLTVMEARRGQSFPNNEIIVGNPSQRIKIIGNSVDRSVSLALGLSLREAWEKNALDDNTRTVESVVKATSVRPARPSLRGEHGRFFKSSNSESSSSVPPTKSSVVDNETGCRATSEVILSSVNPPPVFTRDQHGRYAKDKARAKIKPILNSTPELVRDGRGRFSVNHNGATNLDSKAKRKSISASSNRVISDSYDSDDEEILEEERQDSLEPLAVQPPLKSRQTEAFQLKEKSPSSSKLNSQTTSLKRPYALLAPEIDFPKKNLKGAKFYPTSSPNNTNFIATSIEALNPSEQPRGHPVNTFNLSQKLSVVLTQRFAGDVDSFDDEMAETNSSSSSTGDEEEDDDSQDTDEIEAATDEEDVLMPPSQNAKNLRIATTSSRGQGKSPTKSRPKPQYVIDLTSDGEDEAKPPTRPLANCPFSQRS